MYDGIKKATGSTSTQIAHLSSSRLVKSSLTKVSRWSIGLIITWNQVSGTLLHAVPDLTVMEDVDELPTLLELSKAIDCYECGNASGSDDIPPAVMQSGQAAFLQHLHQQPCLCWEKMYVPQDTQDADTVTLHQQPCLCWEKMYVPQDTQDADTVTLHQQPCLCWEKMYVPQDTQDANTVTLHQHKGDRSDCNNYVASSFSP
eukprot:TRINITY_DN15304_c0_g1_i1.p1 TRINITY_DN15304_c0_g1~~TRINITY_DN15304_c0_g1_i1.p1  ORF type:complete len:202 (-),score=41.50 TRINITY_DN15304_c0_g1_i1:1129-1734(-)